MPETQKEKETVTIIKQVGEILETVYQDPKAYFEVNATIYSDYYEDERVLLKDLLFPETSNLYKSEKFKNLKVGSGFFKKRFLETLNAGEYIELKKAIGIDFSSSNFKAASFSARVPTDTAAEIFSNSSGISIYFPCSENFGINFTATYFDNVNSFLQGSVFVTIVSAGSDANSGPGEKAYKFPARMPTEIRYRAVIVDDNYAESSPTHIVGVAAQQRPLNPPPPPNPIPNVNRVYHGWSRMNGNQLDKLISFTGNGGGSEMKIARISGYLQFQDQQIENFKGDVVTSQYTRKEIRKKRWKRVYSVWDADWVTANLEQTYAIWEEDNKGTKTFTGSLSTTVQAGSNVNITGSVGFNISVVTQDELVTQRKITRSAYFAGAKIDQGWGFNMCDDKGCRFDNTFLTAGNWPIYDAGSIWGYTWPFNTF